MKKTYAALPMNSADLNVGTIYFTDDFLACDVVNPATQVKFTDEEAAKKIVTSTAALIMKGTSILTADGIVAAEGFLAPAMQDVVLSEAALTALHSEFTVKYGVLSARKTESSLKVIQTLMRPSMD